MKNQYTTTPELKQARNEIILRMRNEGYALQKIGDRFNVSREYIRQILKKEYDITGSIKFDPHSLTKADEYSALDLAELTGYEFNYIATQLKKNWLPQPTRRVERNKWCGIDYCYWKKSDIDRWFEIKIKYLKIALEGFINERLAYPYKFTHYRIQQRYKFLQQLNAGKWKGRLSYNSRRNGEVMKEFNNLIKPVQYVPTDYSKYLNMRTKEHFAEKGLYNGTETEKIIGIAGMTIARFRKTGILQQGIHYVTGDHYFQRYMYYPEKTKQAIIDAGYDQKIANAQKQRWAIIRGEK